MVPPARVLTRAVIVKSFVVKSNALASATSRNVCPSNANVCSSFTACVRQPDAGPNFTAVAVTASWFPSPAASAVPLATAFSCSAICSVRSRDRGPMLNVRRNVGVRLIIGIEQRRRLQHVGAVNRIRKHDLLPMIIRRRETVPIRVAADRTCRPSRPSTR